MENETGGWSVQGHDETLAFQFTKNGTDLKIASLPANRPQRETIPNTPVHLHPKPSEPCPVCWSANLTAQVTAWTRTPEGTLAIGLADGTVRLLDVLGNTVWTASGDSAITAISCDHDAVIVGCRSGLILRLDRAGKLQWQQRCHFRNERIYWPYWFLTTPEVASLAMGRDEQRNLDLIVAGTGSTNLVFLNAATGEHLDDVISPYGLPDRIRVHRHPVTGESQFMVGHSRLTCCSSVRAWNSQAKQEICYEKSLIPKGRTDYGWDSCSLVDFQIQALRPDQPERIIVLRQGAVNQLTVYDQTTADPLWDATLGGAPVALVVLPQHVTGDTRCFIADQFGGIVGFDAQGERVFSTRLASSLQGMSATPNGSLVAWSSNQLHLIKDGILIDSLGIKGTPLGFVGSDPHPGFLSSDTGHLHYQEITW